MKILHVIPSLNSRGGGPARSSQGLVAALRETGVDAWIYTLDGSKPWVIGVRSYAEKGRKLKVSDFREFDLVHIHGIWDWGLHKVAEMCRKAGVPYVVAPRGMLEAWSLKQKWLKKRIARFLYLDYDLRMAAALHATAESESEQLRSLGFRNTIILSPNGINVPKTAPKRHGRFRRALFVGRMHPKKGVLELVDAWARVRPLGWDCELVYTLNGDEEKSYEQKVKRCVRDLDLDAQFLFTGSLDDESKWAAYARASLFVLPTYSENFGIVIAEALWAGIPVITTQGAPWRGVEERGCGWWISLPPKESLDAALRIATTTSDLAGMGMRGREFVLACYTWPAVCEKLVSAYEKIRRTHQCCERL